MSASQWDLSALLNAADPRTGRAERHLWLARLLEWLRHRDATEVSADGTPRARLRLQLLLRALEGDAAHRARVRGVLQAFWREIDLASLLAGLGLAPRQTLAGALWDRLLARLLPTAPDTREFDALFPLLFRDGDEGWLTALDDATLGAVVEVLRPDDAGAWRRATLDALAHLAAAVATAGFAPPMRLRMDPALLAHQPFAQLTRAVDAVRTAIEAGDAARAVQGAAYLRAVLHHCREAAASVQQHLTEFGVSVNIVFDADQLRERTLRMERLLDALLAAGPREALELLAELVGVQVRARSLRALWSEHNALLARQMVERSAETGEHYITRTRAEYADMLRRAAGGGAVIAGTTFVKFAIYALGLSAFWNGFAAGANYALSFLLVMLLHWTVATKQPAMTAPAMAARLGAGARSPEQIEAFIDEVAHLIRSQAAGIFGNLALCGPLVWLVQWLSTLALGAPPVGAAAAQHVLHDLTLLGPTALFAAFTGVLLFASSLVAGWAENAFVLRRLDSAIAWHPRTVALVGSARARRWAQWWRENVSGVAANVSLGFMLGLTPAVAGFFGLGLEVRHVTLSTGQLGAALGALGTALLSEPAFWWCVAGIAVTGVLNVAVSFGLAFRLALRARGITVHERSAIYGALGRRLWRQPWSFLWPPR